MPFTDVTGALVLVNLNASVSFFLTYEVITNELSVEERVDRRVGGCGKRFTSARTCGASYSGATG